jgi:Rrf2 family iron-sulfur cluster assembly transcriptional regulator
LANPATHTTVAQIVVAVEEQLDSRQCEGKENCMGEQRCMTHDLWQSLNDNVLEFLSGVTLAELVSKQRAKAQQNAAVIVTNLRAGRDQDKPMPVPA